MNLGERHAGGYRGHRNYRSTRSPVSFHSLIEYRDGRVRPIAANRRNASLSAKKQCQLIVRFQRVPMRLRKFESLRTNHAGPMERGLL